MHINFNRFDDISPATKSDEIGSNWWLYYIVHYWARNAIVTSICIEKNMKISFDALSVAIWIRGSSTMMLCWAQCANGINKVRELN